MVKQFFKFGDFEIERNQVSFFQKSSQDRRCKR